MQHHPPSLLQELLFAAVLIPAFYLFYHGLILYAMALADPLFPAGSAMEQDSRTANFLRTELPFLFGIVNAFILGRGLARWSRFSHLGLAVSLLLLSGFGIFLILEN